MKNFFFTLLFLFTFFGLQAQEQGKIRVGGNIGLAVPPMGAGISIDLLDVRYNLRDNLNVGLKFGGAFMGRDMMEVNSTTARATIHLNSNVMVVGDYYFNKGTSAFAPFVGAGLGSFRIFNIYSEFDTNETVNYTYEELPTTASAIGGAIRGGFELGKMRLALEYYLIPSTVKYNAANIMQSNGTSPNSYLTVNIGFYLGGGQWRK